MNKLIEGECPYDTDERFVSEDFEVLKTLLKDLRKFNRDNQHNLRKDADKILHKRRMIRDVIANRAYRRTGVFYDSPEFFHPKDVDFKIAHRTILNYNKRQVSLFNCFFFFLFCIL